MANPQGRLGSRLYALDGLRGIAALVVVFFHIFCAFIPVIVPERNSEASLFAHTPIAILWNGPFAVAIFFVLSGFVISNASINRPTSLIISVPIRYLRLAVPATASVIFAFVLLTAMPNAAQKVSVNTHSTWLLDVYQNTIPGPLSALYDGLAGIFIRGGSQFNNVLWTMRPELIGSIFCFVVAFVPRQEMRIFLLLGIIAVKIFAGSYMYIGFSLGFLLREIWSRDQLSGVLAPVALLLGLFMGSFSGNSAVVLGLDWLPSAIQPGNAKGLLYPLAAALIVYGCLSSTLVSQMLSQRWAGFLGRISFPLYLIHVPVICTVLASAHLVFAGSPVPFWLTVAASVPAMLFLAHLVEAHAEAPFLRLLGQFRQAATRLIQQ